MGTTKRYLTELDNQVIVRLVESKISIGAKDRPVYQLLIIQPGEESDNFITPTVEVFLGHKMVTQLAEFLNDHVFEAKEVKV